MTNRTEKDIKTLLKEWWHCLGIIGDLKEIGGLEAVAQPLGNKMPRLWQHLNRWTI